MAWGPYVLAQAAGGKLRPPVVPVPVPEFVGLKLALSWGKPERAGRWLSNRRDIDFDWSAKRARRARFEDGSAVLAMRTGHPKIMSLPHRDFLAAGGNEALEALRLVLQEQPDWIDLSPPLD